MGLLEIMLFLLVVVIILLLPFASIGGIIVYNTLVRRKKAPVDKSNRLNHFRLVWFATTREDKFVGLFPWLKKDEWDNISE